MADELDQTCDVCGRRGNIALSQTVGPFEVAVCHLCRHLGVTAAAVAAVYDSPADQRDQKLRRHREFSELPGPGAYAVTRPWHRITGGQLPPLCCVCLGPADDSFAAPMPHEDAPRLGAGGPKPEFSLDPPDAALPSRIAKPGAAWLVFVLAVAVAAAVILPPIAMWPVLLMVVLFLMHWMGGRARHHRYTTLPVPICRACHAAVAPDRPPARVTVSAPSQATVVFSNWEYAELVQSYRRSLRARRPASTVGANA